MIKKILAIGVLLGLILSITFYFKNNTVNLREVKKGTQEKQTQGACLNDDEVAENSAPWDEQSGSNPNMGYFATSPVTIFVKDKKTNTEKRNFQISGNSEGLYTLQLFKCNIYVIRIFNFDEKKGLPLSNYRTEFWRFHYGGEGEKLLELFKKEGAPDNYGQTFRVDPLEQYVVLENGYLGKDNYSLVIKDLKTLEDAFVLPLADIANKNPDFVGSFSMRQWTKDSRYFWGDIFDGADVLAVFRVDSTTWKWEVFEVPPYTMGGTALNAEHGYITYDDGPSWTGDVEFDQINKAKWLKEGKKLNFYLYNVFTKKQILLETVDDPLWSFKPEWLSDTELQYELPSGERKVYKIDN